MAVAQAKASTSRVRIVPEIDEATAGRVDGFNARFLVEQARASASAETKERNVQYANIYYMRLAKLKPRVLQTANLRWSEAIEEFEDAAKYIDRVLEVRQGELCYIIGTIYIEMKLKPNVLEDLAREHHLVAPPPREKYTSPGEDDVMLEDESGRVRLVGDSIASRKWTFVTGIIVGVLGAENAAGDFEVLDICHAGIPPQLPRPLAKEEVNGVNGHVFGNSGACWVALVSGLELGGAGDADDIRTAMLTEWLTGELEMQGDSGPQSVSRLILAGCSIRQPAPKEDLNKQKVYGYDSSIYTPHPTAALTSFLVDLLPSIDVDIMPGESDPAAPTLPQQPIHPALLYEASKHEGLKFLSNPSWFEFGGTTILGTSGQTLDDVYRYIDGTDRIEMARLTLEWSHMAPSAPDTLWCHPFANTDPFLLGSAPHVYFIGNQPKFATDLVKTAGGQPIRIILVPKFVQTGEMVLVNTLTFDVRVIQMRAP